MRAQLRGKVDLHDRLVGSGHFAHNKFVVACDSAGKPQRVLSGSTNWTKTGLCTQANNGIIVEDPDLGAHFIDQWNLLKAAGNAYPASLMQANATSKAFNVDGGSITQWFAPTDKGEDLDYARKLINGAQEGILFLFFNPGAFEPDDEPERWTLLQNILARHQQGSPNYDGDLYIHGVVNQEIPGLTTEGPEKPSKHAAADPTNPSPVKLYDGGKTAPIPVPYESMVPKAIKDVFHAWASEVMNQGVHVHSKVIVIDPFGRNPVVITGSHNLGYKASTKNDDNMMIVEDNAPLAASYAANIIAIYQTYRWNTYVDAHAKDPQVWHGLVDNATWQDSLSQTRRRRSGRDQVLARRGCVRRDARSGSGAGGHGSSGRDRKRTIAIRKEALSIRPLRKKGAGKESKTEGGPTLGQANSVEAESRTGETNAGEIEACYAVKKAPAKTRRAPAKKAPPKSRMARMKSTRAAAARRASGKIASRTPRRGR